MCWKKKQRLFYENVKRFACREVVSAEFHPYFEKMRKMLESVDAASDPEFVFSDLYQRLGQLEKMITERMEAVSEQSRMKLVKITGGKNELAYADIWISLWSGSCICIWYVSTFNGSKEHI